MAYTLLTGLRSAAGVFHQTGILLAALAALAVSPPAGAGDAPALTGVAAPAAAEAVPPVFAGEIPPGDYVAFRWDGSTLEPLRLPALTLSARAESAVAHSPQWLQRDLAAKLTTLEPALQDALAQVILRAHDRRLVDEIAFCVAFLPSRELTDRRFIPQVLYQNARLLYAADAALDYVELVDHGRYADGDWFTTARYRLQGAEGREEYYELPREVYYWYVVYPKLGRERIACIDPVTGEESPPGSAGVFWRDYLLHQDADPARCASTHFVLEHPHLMNEVPACAQGAQQALTGFAIDPLPLITDAAQRPLLCTFSWPGSQFDAQVYATTIPLELGADESSKNLRENLLRAGSASALLNPCIVPEGFDGVRMAILKDRDPFGEPVIERTLARWGFQYSVFTSDRLAEMLAPEAGFIKVIIPSGQPRQLYERLAASESLWREWMTQKDLSHHRVVEFHGACDPAFPGDNWEGLTMPWQFGCAPRAAGTLSLAGYPKLLQLLSRARYLWNHQPLTVSGDRPFSPGACALELLGYFVTQNLPDRCAEVPYYYRGPDADAHFRGDAADYVQSLRSPYPQRSLYLHYGNCGEVGDILTAACRAALVPARDVVAHPVDHVWNSVYLEGKWRTYTVFRSDEGTRFDDGVYTESNHVGPMACRSDGYVDNTIGDYFGSTFVAAVKVTDANGQPVDGAAVAVLTGWVHEDPPPKIHAGLAWTGLDGVARIELGSGRDFFVQVYTPLEDWPALVPDTSDKASKDTEPRHDPVLERRRQMKAEPALLVRADGITPSATVHQEVALGFALPYAQACPEAAAPAAPSGTTRLRIQVPEHLLHGYSSYFDCDFTLTRPGGTLGAFVVDRENYGRFIAGEPFAAACALQDAGSATLPLPSSPGEWVVVLSNRHRLSCGQCAVLVLESP